MTPVAVFGEDDRQPLPEQYGELKQEIGLLHNPRTNILCTAFCVSDDMIATASHCLFSHQASRRLHLSDFMFKLQPTDSQRPVFTRLAGSQHNQSRQFVVAGTSSLSRKPPIGAARDWAVVRLDRPVCRDHWLPTRNLSHESLAKAAADNNIFQVAFHTDFGNWDIAYSRACTIDRNYGSLTWQNIKQHFSEPQALILHSCDTGEASSGSPLLMDTDSGPVVVGINVGTYQQRDITIRDGKIVRYSKFRTIANTAVSSTAFATDIDILRKAQVITETGELKSLQSNLRERGFYVGDVDGVYGTRTELAVKAFERTARRPVTGLPTRAILAELRKSGQSAVSIDTSEGSSQSAGFAPPDDTSSDR